ncbi:MAG: protein phosphatase 2C domain-containing protein [Bifidobacteriaceae bacterium]|jgi:protein phosphatase|nr:protein phosphatase 2C domain-containing protein [Bifidobacteriaceae bacterium]
MNVAFRYAARSDIGLTRSNNQDSGYAGPHLLVVADGMGGHAGGDIASSVAIAHLVPLDDDNPGADDAARHLDDAVTAAHDELLDRVAETPELAGLGTTITAILRSGDRLVLGHIGDSRAYLLRNGVLEQVTTDHTFVQYLVESGKLEADQAERHPQRSLLLRVLGDVDLGGGLDISVRGAQVGDRWLLCSDGLSGVVSTETLTETLIAQTDPGSAADSLVDLALRGGGPDNVTCIVADVVNLDTVADGKAPPMSVEVVGAAAIDRDRPTRGGSGAAGRAARLVAKTSDDAGTNPTRWRRLGRRHRRPTRQAGDLDDLRRRRPIGHRVAAVIVGIVVVVGIAAGGIGAYRWTQSQYYVGESGGRVAIYQGIAQRIGPLRLSHAVVTSAVDVASLPRVSRDRLATTIAAGSMAEAEAKLATFLRDAGPQSTLALPSTSPSGSSSPSSPSNPSSPSASSDPADQSSTTRSAPAPTTSSSPQARMDG